MKIRTAMLGLICLALLGPIPPLPATQFIPLTIEQMAEEAQVILHGKVLNKSTQRNEAGRIYTRIELQVTEVWKGRIEGERFTIVQAGGTLGDRRVAVSGQAEFTVGEEIIAFTVLNRHGHGVILGLAQGKFEVSHDPVSNQKQARNLFHGGPPPQPGRARSQLHAKQRLAVGDLKQRIQSGRQ
jgi:hypothetical protein